MKKRIVYLLFLLPVFIYAQQTEEYFSYLFVSAPNGLRVRESFALNSRVVSVIEFGKQVNIIERTTQQYTIDDINSYWYKIYAKSNNEWITGWVFGGYLTDRFETNPIVGFWNNELDFWIFRLDGTFEYSQDNGSGREGAYQLDSRNNIILNFIDPYEPVEIIRGRVQFINNNRIRLILSNNITLNRR